MEDLRNRMDVRLTTNAKYYQKLVSKSSFVWNKNFIFQKFLYFLEKANPTKMFYTFPQKSNLPSPFEKTDK